MSEEVSEGVIGCDCVRESDCVIGCVEGGRGTIDRRIASVIEINGH